jgi:hypothetical protein
MAGFFIKDMMGMRMSMNRSDDLRRIRMLKVEFLDKSRSMNIMSRFPRIVTSIITFPLDQIPELASDEFTVQDFLHNIFLYIVNKDWRWRWLGSSTRDGIMRGRSEPDNMEDRMDA